MATRPTVAWDEILPAAESSFILGDNRLREVKKQFREVFEEDHTMLSSGNGDAWGFHHQVTLLQQSAYPTPVASAGIFFTREVSAKCELFYIDENGLSQQLTSGGTFIGGMVDEVRMWSGTLAELTALAGWELCQTPNLIAKFIHGINTTTTEPGTTDGSDAITLTTANLQTHTHTVANGSVHEHSYNLYKTAGGTTYRVSVGGGPPIYSARTTETTGKHTHTTVSSYGNGTNTIENRPAYVELAFIKRS